MWENEEKKCMQVQVAVFLFSLEFCKELGNFFIHFVLLVVKLIKEAWEWSKLKDSSQ